MESLPPENNSTGRSNSAATSRDDVDGFGLQQAQMAQLVLAGCGAHRHIAGHGFLFHVLIPDKSGRIDHIYGYCHLCNQASLSLSTQPPLGGLPVRQCALG